MTYILTPKEKISVQKLCPFCPEAVAPPQLRDGTPLIASLTRAKVFPLGTPLHLGFEPKMAHLFA